MEQHLLGDRTGLAVSAVALGTGRLGLGADGTALPGEARRVLRAFADAGGTFVDTSSAYLGGEAEVAIGAVMAEVGRDRFVVASKFGLTAEARAPRRRLGLHRAALLAEVEGSLRRLGTDRIDLYLPHLDDGATPVEELTAALDDLVRAGKVLHVGLSNFPAWRAASAALLAELRGRAPVAVLQLSYGLSDRTAEREHLPLARARALGVMGYSPLGGGALARRLREPGAAEGAAGGDALAARLHEVAREVGRGPQAVALAWVRAKGVVPIVGPRTADQLADTLAGLEVALSPAQVGRLDAVTAPALGQPYEVLAQTRAALGLGGARVGERL